MLSTGSASGNNHQTVQEKSATHHALCLQPRRIHHQPLRRHNLECEPEKANVDLEVPSHCLDLALNLC
jgi:hypothetical protein